MKKFTLPHFPRIPRLSVVYRHFKKKPSRLVVWISICAIIVALVITLVNPNLSNRAKAAITVIGSSNNPTQVSLVGDINASAFIKDQNTIRKFDGITLSQYIYLNDYIIDADGYLKVRYYPDIDTNDMNIKHPYSFEYVYYHDGSGSRIKLGTNTDLVIDGANTRVYMEGVKEETLKLKSLTISNGALLTQVPAGRDGLNNPFSTNSYWGVRFFGYYALAADQQAQFNITPPANTQLQMQIGAGRMDEDNNLDSDIGNYYYLNTSGTRCVNGDIITYIDGMSNCNFPVIANRGGNTQYFPFEINIYYDFNNTIGNPIASLDLQHRVWDINSGGEITNNFETVPTALIYGLNADGTRNATAQTVGMAYYFESSGARQNRGNQISFGAGNGWNLARSFQTLDAKLYNQAGNNDNLWEYGMKRSLVIFNGIRYTSFEFEWNERDSRTGWFTMFNPISQIFGANGEDYLLAPVAEYVKNSKAPNGLAGLMLTEKNYQRQSLINLELTGNVYLSNGGKIDVTGKGYSGGMGIINVIGSRTYNRNHYVKPNAQWANGYYDPSSIIDSPLDGAGPGGGSGDWADTDVDVYSGSYGGSGTIMDDAVTGLNPTLSAKFNGLTYGGAANVHQPFKNGSGGGYFQNRMNNEDFASIGGSGGGVVHLKANNLILDPNTSIKANGGHGWVGMGACFGQNTVEVETRGELGKTGYKILENRWCDNTFGLDPIEAGTSGSGGSVWLEITNIYTNNGNIEARGVEGAARAHLTFDNTTASTYYYHTYYNSDKWPKCSDNDTMNFANAYGCQGPGSGGGRMAIYFGSSTNDDANKPTTDPTKYLGNVSVWGGGTIDGSDNNYDLGLSSRIITDLVGTAGSLVTGPNASSSVNVRNINIEKLVNRLSGDPGDCNGAGVTITTPIEAYADGNDWVAVNIKVTNNTTKSQDGVIVKDELFKGVDKSTVKPCDGGQPNPFGNGNEITWTLPPNFAIGTTQTLRYYFQVDSTTN